MILISGSSGFVGQNLLKALPLSAGVSLRNEEWGKQIQQARVIINLVGKAHDHKGQASKEDFYYANVDLTKLVFNEYLKSEASLMIHISSIAAVEEYESLAPLTEEHKCNPISWYGKSKREAEEWLLDQNIPENKKLIILRPPMIHGPGDKGNLGMLYKFISKGLPYPFSGFKNSRSFISIGNFNFYISDIIKKYKKLDNGIYHISDNEPISTEKIIDIIKMISGGKIIKLDMPKSLINFFAKLGEILPIPFNKKRLKKLTSTLVVSNIKINSALQVGKLPETGEEGVVKTIKWFKKNGL